MTHRCLLQVWNATAETWMFVAIEPVKVFALEWQGQVPDTRRVLDYETREILTQPKD